MIHSLELKGPAFHRFVRFKEGLNLVYGERRIASEEQGTCNSLGKSSFLWTIDYCLGANPDRNINPKKGLPSLYLDGWEFTLDFDLGDRRIKATRSVVDEKTVYVDGEVAGLPVEPTQTINPNAAGQVVRYAYDIDAWRMLLGAVLFDIPIGGPSFREVFGYFCRKKFEDARYPVATSTVDELSRNLGYLFGLNWECVRAFSDLSKTGKDAKTIYDAAKLQLSDWQTTVAKLKRECREKGEELSQCRERLESFVVDPVYREKESAANELTEKITKMRNRIVANRRNLAVAQENVATENISVEDLRRLYEEAAVVFHADVLRALEETAAFHRSITTNRQDVVNEEIRRLKRAIKDDEAASREMDARRAELLRHLSSCGALSEYTNLNEMVVTLREELALKQRCLDDYAESKAKIAEVREGKARLHEELSEDFSNRGSAVLEADRVFGSITTTLYRQPGSLGIKLRDTSKNIGYVFNPDHEGTGGTGIDKMMGFVLDVTILLRQKAQGRKIDFMLHDGELFTSADTRQRADALKLIDRWSRMQGFQYITGMNYDVYPDAAIGDAINRGDITILTLHDASPDGKLYGFSFDPQSIRPPADESTAE